MLPMISQCLTVFALFTRLSYASGSSCTNLCPGPFNSSKCCDDEFQFASSSSTRDNETDGFPNTDTVIGLVIVILIICSCCPCCILYKRRKNGAIYRRFDVGGALSRRKKKGIVSKGVQKTETSVPSINQIPSVTVVASQPVQVNFPQSYSPGQMMEHALYNHLPQPQATPFPTVVQSPPPCTVAVICDSHHRQPAYNPMYRQ